MFTLRLEELESRHLLSGSYYAPQPQSRFMPPPENGPTLFAVQPPTGDFHGGPAAYGGWDIAPQPFGGDPPAPMRWIVITIRLQDVNPTPGGSDAGSYQPAVAAPPRSAPADAGSIVAAAEVASNRAVAARVISQTPFTIVPSVTVPALAAEVQGPVAAQSPIHFLRPGDGIIGPAGPAGLTQLPTLAGVATPPAADEVQPAETTPPVPAPAERGPLAALPAVDIAALGRGLERFLVQLERAGEELVGDGDGLRPWLVAGAAAAAACEIARRQFRRAAEMAVLLNTADHRSDRLFVGTS
jgi:hypothetical protein